MTVIAGQPEKIAGEGKRTLADFTRDRICQALISGRIKAGEKLTLRGMSEAFGISTTPIRDAVRQLAAQNILDFAPNKHIRVAILTGAQLRELRDIRVALEGMAVERAAERIDAETVQELRDRDTQIRALRDAGLILDTVETIQHFHSRLYQASGLDNLVEMIQGLRLRTAPYNQLLFPEYSGRERGSLRRMLLDALGRRDSKAARRYVESDISGAMDFIIEQVENGALALDSEDAP